jgi:hypothetical protein
MNKRIFAIFQHSYFCEVPDIMSQHEKLQVGVTIHVKEEDKHFLSVVRLTLFEWYNQYTGYYATITWQYFQL